MPQYAMLSDMKKMLVGIMLLLVVQGLCFARGIAEERVELEFAALSEQLKPYLITGDYTSAIPMLKRMHELMPQELYLIENLGILYSAIPEDRPLFTNSMYWLLEAEKRNSRNDSIYYCLACIYSINDDLENAIKYMDKAISYGWADFEWMSQDTDLANLRTTAWWKNIEDIQCHEYGALLRY